ncbi:hypothetical protein JW916_02090 [Candidatus Sumerlaeota bacterium]|nr:hypothetical protein [Candidatus Sumerlaeota bacterium]
MNRPIVYRCALALVVLFYAGFVWWTWMRWPDPVVDFGREIYTPWRLNEGDTLYKDVAWFNGPLSAFWNAAVLRILGTSVRSLAISNLAILAGMLLLLNSILRNMYGKWPALWCLLVVAWIFAFGRYLWLGNNNYVTPYSHEITHGLFLSLLALHFQSKGMGSRKAALLYHALCGAALAGCFLTKVEMFVAATMGVAAGQVAFAILERRLFKPFLGAATGFLLAVLPFAIWSWIRLGPWPGWAQGVFGSLHYSFNPRLRDLHFYRWTMGTDYALANALFMVRTFVLATLLVVLVSALSFKTAGRRLSDSMTVLLTVLVASVLFAFRKWTGWSPITAMLPFAVVAQAFWLILARMKAKEPSVSTRDFSSGMAFLSFALFLMLKIFLKVRVYHYGFVLAMPAMLATVGFLVGTIPSWLERRGANDRLFRAIAIGAVIAFSLVHFRITVGWYRGVIIPFGEEGDRIWISDSWTDASSGIHEGRGRVLYHLLNYDLTKRIGPDQTLLVLPEGVAINYWIRRPSPTRYVNFMPPEWTMFGEEEIVGAIRAHPPDYVLLLHRPTPEYGDWVFGKDSGKPLYDWVKKTYVPIEQWGTWPFTQKAEYGAVLFKSKSLFNSQALP